MQDQTTTCSWETAVTRFGTKSTAKVKLIFNEALISGGEIIMSKSVVICTSIRNRKSSSQM